MTGRPTEYTDEIAIEICQRLANGESLRKICDPETRDDFMPGRQTVLDWLEENTDFRARYERAREAQGDAMDDLVLETAETCTPENAAAARVKIAAYQWRAEKLKPKKYGAAVQLKHADADGEKLDQDPTATAARIAALLAAGQARKDAEADG